MVQIPENHWLKKLKDKLQAIDPSIELILYGSRARGTASENSDWDLLLLTEREKLSFQEQMKIRRPLTLMELELAQVLSLQIFNEKEWHSKFQITPFYENVQKDGIPI
ncbi:MAG: nucleotidyltransferase domain-containing protein [Microscillaceae bacterium]|nr:nucleotidyltransferase domain-containing protein [Microscillaceae bacterium]